MRRMIALVLGTAFAFATIGAGIAHADLCVDTGVTVVCVPIHWPPV